MLKIIHYIATAGRAMGRRGSVALLFAICLLPIVGATMAAVDMSRLSDGRAILQRAVDNAALSGASSYSTSSFNTLSITTTTTTFCNMVPSLPAGLTLVSSGNVYGTQGSSCVNSSGVFSGGPSYANTIGGYKPGTPGIDHDSGCTATNTVPANGDICGYMVTVVATATMSSSLPSLFGQTNTISVVGIAMNPFLNLGKVLNAAIAGSAYNTNSVWVYPVLLNGQGTPDFSSNLGAIPTLVAGVYPADASPSGCASLTSCGSLGTAAGLNCQSNTTANSCLNNNVTGCTDSPAQFTCGNFVMIADTAYNTAACSAGCYPNGSGSYPEFIAGVVQKPQAPTAVVTATTPIAFAFQSIAGGGSGYNAYTYPGTSYANTYLNVAPPSGCTFNYPSYTNGPTYPNYPANGVYTTAVQSFSNGYPTTQYTSNPVSGSYNGGTPGMDWPKVTHWFYSSYLANGYPPSEGEILSQTSGLQSYTYPNYPGGKTVTFNTRVPLLGVGTGTTTYSPTLSSCDQNSTNTTYSNDSYDEFVTTTFPTQNAPRNGSGGTTGDNASLYIIQQQLGATPPTSTSTGYYGQVFYPNNTPGANGNSTSTNFAALSCQAYGNYQYTFFWNDMGGSQGFGDDLDYNNGSVTVKCGNGASVVLIQ